MTVIITDNAAKRINTIMSKEPAGSMLRVSVNGGGCSGFQYAFEVATSSQQDDHTFIKDGATILVDEISLQYLTGATIDFVDDIMGQAFRIDNPIATSSCGCGTSFSI